MLSTSSSLDSEFTEFSSPTEDFKFSTNGGSMAPSSSRDWLVVGGIVTFSSSVYVRSEDDLTKYFGSVGVPLNIRNKDPIHPGLCSFFSISLADFSANVG
jgi:hypothetical protein